MELKSKGRILVLYFDNFDRLPVQKIKALWASIHSFFAENSYSNVWVIVPYDEQRILKAFDEGESNIADGLLQKTFSVSFRVTPPLVSQWKALLLQMLKDAFEEADYISELEYIYEIYNHQTDRSGMTPRHIKNFVNDLVALKIQNPDIKLRYIALFALTKKEILKDPTEKILKKDYLKKSLLWFKGDEFLDENLASLTYGVEPKLANEILVKQKIERIISGDSDSLEISDFSNKAVLATYFDEVFTEFCDHDFIDEPISHIPAVLKEIESAGFMVKSSVERYWNIFYETIQGNGYFQDIDGLTEALIKHMPPRREDILKRILKYNSDKAKDEEKEEQYLNLLTRMEEYIENEQLDINLGNISPEVGVKPVSYLNFLSGRDEISPKLYNVSTESEDLNAFFGSEEDKINLENIDSFKEYIPFLVGKYDLSRTKDLLKAEIEQSTPNNENNVQERIDRVRAYRPFRGLTRLKLAPIQNYFIYLTGNKGGDDDKSLLMGYCLAHLNECYAHQTFKNFLNSSSLDITEVVNYTNEFSMSFVSFLIKADEIGNSPEYLKKCVINYFNRNCGGIYLDTHATYIIENYNDIIVKYFNSIEERKRFSLWLDKYSDKVLLAFKKLEVNEISSELIGDMFQQETPVYQIMKQEISNHYLELTNEEWLDVLKEFDDLPNGLKDLIDEGKNSFINDHLYNAFEEFIHGIVNGGIATVSNVDLLDSFVKLLHRGKMRPIFRRAADYFRLHSNDVPSEAIKYLHNYFVEFGKFIDFPDDISVGIFHRLILDSELFNECIKPHLEFYVDILSNAKEYKEGAINDLATREQEFSEEQLKSIRRKLKTKAL